MNKNELIVERELEKKGYHVTRLNTTQHIPDFLINNSFYIEVKSLDSPNQNRLSNNQEIVFSKLNKPIKIIFVKRGVIIGEQNFESLIDLPNMTKTINETFEDREYQELIEKKGKRNWRQFILDLAKIKKEDENNKT